MVIQRANNFSLWVPAQGRDDGELFQPLYLWHFLRRQNG